MSPDQLRSDRAKGERGSNAFDLIVRKLKCLHITVKHNISSVEDLVSCVT